MSPQAERAFTMGERIWDVLMKGAVPISIALAGAVIKHEVELGKIQETRFTQAQGLEMKADVMEQVRREFPPDWLREQMNRIEGKVDLNATKLEKLDDRIDDLERGG